jgi:hypothetical protein
MAGYYNQQQYPPQPSYEMQPPQVGYDSNNSQPQYQQPYQPPPGPPPQQGPPPGDPKNSYGGQTFDQTFAIQKPKWNDLWAGILFLVVVAGFVAVSGISLQGYGAHYVRMKHDFS